MKRFTLKGAEVTSRSEAVVGRRWIHGTTDYIVNMSVDVHLVDGTRVSISAQGETEKDATEHALNAARRIAELQASDD